MSSRQLALENINFEIKPGELAALVGPSGAGKTTITYFLPRLVRPYRRLHLPGWTRFARCDPESLAQAIGMVTQETYLFHDTLRTNLLYAKPDATQAEIEAACQAANIHHFIASLPDGYETVVGERGYRLSGGRNSGSPLPGLFLRTRGSWCWTKPPATWIAAARL